MKKHIPNAITCCNLLSGSIGIVLLFNGFILMAAALIFVAAIFDFFDGFFARILKVASPIGKELDSLADMVSFGLLPGFIMMKLVFNGPFDGILAYISLLAMMIPVFSALRLAKFNIDTRQSDSFIGLPTPANAFFIASLPFIVHAGPKFAQELILNLGVQLGLIIMMSILMVIEIPLIALKFKGFTWKGNETKILLILISLLLILFLQFTAIPLVLLLYLVLSMVQHFFKIGERKEG